MKIPFNKINIHKDFTNQTINTIKNVIERGCFVQGPEHAQFEADFASYCGADHCVAVGNGTEALELALRSVGIVRGDEVILQANAGFYSSTALLAIDAIPVYADILEENHQLDPASIKRMLGPKVKAVIMTHLYGKMGDVKMMRDICDECKIVMIEDCAQSHGAIIDDKKAGAWGDVAAFSFYPTKNLGAFGDGGAIVTSNAIFAENARQIRQYGWSSKYYVEVPGRNSRLDEFQAAVLNLKLPLLDEENEIRRSIVRRYGESTQGELSILHWKSGKEFVGHLAVAIHPERDRVRMELSEEGIETVVHYPVPDHLQPCMKVREWRSDDLKITELMCKRIFSLPCYPRMKNEDTNVTCNAIQNCNQ